ncbi:MAG: hypothetical protein ABI651_19910, partial [Verrucomicrobiota bacterium]
VAPLNAARTAQRTVPTFAFLLAKHIPASPLAEAYVVINLAANRWEKVSTRAVSAGGTPAAR